MGTGVFGGTFDPIHRAHVELARLALDQLELARVIFIPAGQPWLKTGQPLTAASHRLAMVRLAAAGEPNFSVSDIEINRPGPTYTVDTLEELRLELAEAEELHLIVGTDVLAQFHRWKYPQRILRLCRLAVAKRAGPGEPAGEADGEPDIDGFLNQFPGARGKVNLLDAHLPDISGTRIRDHLSHGESAGEDVSAQVQEYIERFGLYRRESQINAE